MLCRVVNSLIPPLFRRFHFEHSTGKFTVGDLQTDHDEVDDCKSCGDGQFWDVSLSKCDNCAAGKISTIENNFECDECGEGTFRPK